MKPRLSLAKAISRRFAVVVFLASATSLVTAVAFSYVYRSYSSYYTTTLPATIAASKLRESTLQINVSMQQLAQATSELIRQSVTTELQGHADRATEALRALQQVGVGQRNLDEIDHKFKLLISSIAAIKTLVKKKVDLSHYAQDIAARLNQISRSDVMRDTWELNSDDTQTLQTVAVFREIMGYRIRLMLGLTSEFDRVVIKEASAEFRQVAPTLDALLPKLSGSAASRLAEFHKELSYLGSGERDAFRVRLEFLDLLDAITESEFGNIFYGNQVSTQISHFEQSVKDMGRIKLADLADDMLRFYWLLVLPPLATIFLGLEAYSHIRRTVINSILRLERSMRLNADGNVCEIEITSPLDEVQSMEKSALTFLERRTEAERRLVATQVDLRQALERAEAGERSKSEFLAKMSHDLRTPLHAIIGYAHLVSEKVEPGSDVEAHARSIEASGARLLGQIEEILYFSKFDAATYKVKLTPCRVAAVIDEAVDMIRLKAQQAGLGLEVAVAAETPDSVLTNGELIRRIITNLLSNAIKYTERGVISLSVTYRDEHLILTVQDTGIGIPASDRERMFLPFVQLGRSGGKTEGVGLGLAIVQSALHRLGGTIGVDETPGGGTTFFVSVPCREYRVDDAREPDDFDSREMEAGEAGGAPEERQTTGAGSGSGIRYKYSRFETSGSNAREPSSKIGAGGGGKCPASRDIVALRPVQGGHGARTTSERQTPSPSAVLNQKPRVLVVDDEPALASLQKEVLELAGYQVTLATTGEEALAIFSENPDSFAALISDQRMPGMQGIELIDKVLQRRPDLPVVLMSGDRDVIGNRLMVKPNFKFLQKPVSFDVMIADLGRLLERFNAA